MDNPPLSEERQSIHMWIDCAQIIRSYSQNPKAKCLFSATLSTVPLFPSLAFAVENLFEGVLRFFHGRG